jgi:hypothetical protein
VAQAVLAYLLTLPFHTKRWTDVEVLSIEQALDVDVDVKAWSRQGSMLRAQTKIDAGNAVYTRTWKAACLLVETIEAKDDPADLRQFAEMIRQACNRFSSPLGENEEKNKAISWKLSSASCDHGICIVPEAR